jgi:gliding motility-associated-like protein
MKNFLFLVVLVFFVISGEVFSCTDTKFTLTSTSSLGDCKYRLNFRMCVDESNDSFYVGGILIRLTGANIIAVSPMSLTSSQGVTINATITGNVVEWGCVICPKNNTPPKFLNNKDGAECFNVSIDVAGMPTAFLGVSEYLRPEGPPCPVGQVFNGPCPPQCTSTSSSNGQCTCMACGNSGPIYNGNEYCGNVGNITGLPGVCGPSVTINGSSVCLDGCYTITPATTSGTAPYTYSWSPGGATTPTYNACPKATTIYTVTVTDNKGATATDTAVVRINPVPVITTTTAPPSCSGGSNGSATATVSGASAPYTYAWSPPPASGTGATVSNLPAGTYTVTVTDGKGCTSTATAVVTEPPPLSVITSATAAKCGASDGSATAVPSGGTPAYTYAWAPVSGTTATLSNIPGGNYTVTVTDSKGCTKTATVTVPSTGATKAVISNPVNASCAGYKDGSAMASASGGPTPYTYSWSTSPAQTGTTATGLGAGIYTVTVTDATGCQSTASVTITEPPPIVLTTSKTDANCGGSDGSATMNASSGAGAPFTYAWSPSGGTTATATGLAAGTYTVLVTDKNGCTKDTTVSVADIGSPTVSTSKVDILCYGNATGSISTTVSGGVPPYTYSWLPTGGSAANASNLAAGTYTVIITGANNCKATAIVTLTEPPLIVLTSSKTDANCSASDGSVTINATGGVSPYTYAWSGGGSSATKTGVPSGSYTVTVTDKNACTMTAVVSVSDIGAPSVTATSTNVKCNGGNDGTASATATAGVTPYTYSWNSTPVQNTANATGLKMGTYVLTVTAANGCKATTSVTITEPPAIVLTTSSINESCGRSNGTATVMASGGTGAYTYLWSNAQTSTTASGLSAGNYTVTVSDANGCSKTVTASPINIPGPKASFSFTDRCVNTPVSFTNTSTPAGLSYSWDFGDSTTSVLANPVHTYSTAGNKSVKLLVTDAGGCKDSVIKLLTVYPLPLVAFGDTAKGCSPLTANFTNGSSPGTYVWDLGDNKKSTDKAPSHQYVNTTQSPLSFTIKLIVTSAQGCVDSLTKPRLVTVYPKPVAAFSMDPTVTEILAPTISFFNQSIGDSLRTWRFGDGDSSHGVNPTHTYRNTGTYTVCLDIVNAFGCPSTKCGQVIIKPIWSFYIPNAFTPDGNGKNETFGGLGINIHDYKMYIFDRWGDLLFVSNSMDKQWDGKANNGSLFAQEDVYVYVVVFKDPFEKRHRYVGSVTLIK